MFGAEVDGAASAVFRDTEQLDRSTLGVSGSFCDFDFSLFPVYIGSESGDRYIALRNNKLITTYYSGVFDLPFVFYFPVSFVF